MNKLNLLRIASSQQEIFKARCTQLRGMSRALLFVSAAVAVCISPSGFAGPFLWDGGGADNNWTTANNWSNNVAPTTAPNDYAFDGSVRLTPSADGGTPWSVNSLIFMSGAGAFTLSSTTTLNLDATGIVNRSTASQVISAPLALQATAAIGVTNTGSLTLSGLVSGAFGIQKTGPGSLTLSAANSYTGITTVSSGTIVLGAAGGGTNTPLGTTAGATDIKGTGAALNLSGFTLGTAEAITLRGTGVGGTGALTNSTGTVTYSGVVTLGNNTATNGAAIGGAGNISLTAGITGDFNLTKVGAGTLTLNGASTRSAGNTSVETGTLKLGSTTALGTTATPLLLKGGTLDLATDSSVNAYNTTVSATSTITAERATAGAGVTHTLGTLSINGSTLTVNTAATATSGTSGLTFGATTVTGNATFDVINGSTATTTLTLGALTDSGTARTLTKTGNGTLTLGSAATSLVNGTAVNITAGTLNSNNATALGSLANVTVSGSGATFGLGASQTVGALNGAGSGTVSLGANTLTVGSATNNLDSSFTGTIAGTGALTKAGNGTFTVTGNNTYSGATTISTGTLKLGSAGNATNTPLGTTGGATTVSSGGSLDLNGFTLGTAEGLTINGTGVRSGGALTNTGGSATWSGTVALGSAASIGGTGNILLTAAVSGAQALTKVGTNTVTLQANNTNSSTVTITGGGLTLNGAAGAFSNATNFTLRSGGTLTLDNTSNNLGTRLNDAGTFTANGGTLNFTHAVDTGAYSETVGALTLNSGGFNVNLSAATGAGTSAFTVASITRAAGGTMLFTAAGLGASNDNAFVSTAAPTLSASSILPWAVLNDSGTYNVVTYNGTGTTSMKALARTDTAQASWANTVNTMNTADQTLTANRSIGSITLNNGIDITTSSTTDRTITFGNGTVGGLLLQTGGSSNLINNGNGEVILNFGTGTEGFITTIGNITHERGNGANLITGTGGVTKSGGGAYIIEGINANSGVLTINDGTWRVQRYAATTQVNGNPAGDDVIANKGVLELAGDSSATFSNSATRVNSDFTIRPDRISAGTGAGITQTMGTLALNNGATLTVAPGSNVTTAPITLLTGAVTLGATDATINNSGALANLTLASITGAGNNLTITGDGNTTVTGAITTTTGTLIKNGTGTLTLNGTSTFTGLTTVNAGTLTLGHATDTFAATAPVTINGGTLALGTNSDSLGAVTLQSGSITGSVGGTLTPTSLDAQSGTISAIIGGTGILTKSTSGTVTLTGTNTYTGNTSIQTGTLQIGAGGTAGSLASGSAIINNSALVFNRSDAIAVANTISGNGAITHAGASTLTLSGANTGYTGAATVNSGATLVITNTDALGDYTDGVGSASNAGTTVASGGTIKIDGTAASVTPSNGTLTVGGTGVGGAGAIILAVSGVNFARWAGDITLTANTLVTNIGTGVGNFPALGTTSAFGNFRALDSAQTPVDTSTISLGSNTLTITGNSAGNATATTYINGRVTGTGGLTIDMNNAADDVRLGAYMNTFTGTTTVKGGTLTLRSIANSYPGDPSIVGFYGINGPMVIGDGVGSADTAILNSGSGSRRDQMNFTTDVTINTDGKWVLESIQNINSLTMTGGTIELGAALGSLYLGGNVTTNASATSAVIQGTSTSTLSLTTTQGGAVTLPNSTRTFTVADGAASSDLTINTVMNNGSFIKAGLGTMTIMNDNSGGYEGTTTVNLGILNIRNATSLGQASNIDSNATTVNGTGTTDALGVTVGTGAANGTLQLQGTGTVASEKLTLSGMGYLNTGALQNISGSNTWTGDIVLSAASRIQSDADTLTVSSIAITGTNTDLDVRGAGNTTLTTLVNTGTGVLTKEGTGTLTLNGSGSSGYTGTSTVFNGVVSLQTAGGLGATTAGTIVKSGAALEISNATYGGSLTTLAEPLSLSGTGISGTGALRNSAGSNTFSGLVTLAADSLITAYTGQQLTISGGTSATNQTMTVGTVAQNGNIIVSGNVANGTGALIKNGSGSLTFSGTLTGAGNTTVNAGTVNFNGTAATVDQVHLLGTSTISVGAGSLLTTDEFDSAVGTTLAIASGGVVTANYNVGNTVFSGQITGSGGTFKALGAGQVTFDTTIINSGLNVWFGGTSVGTNASPLTVTITGATTLQFSSLRITGDTILDFGNSSASVLNSASLTIDANVLITVQNWISLTDAWYATSTFAGGLLDRTGSTPENQITFTGFSNNQTTWATIATYGYFEHEIRPVPEPSTYGAIFVSGAFGLIAYRRYRRRTAPAAGVAPAKAE